MGQVMPWHNRTTGSKLTQAIKKTIWEYTSSRTALFVVLMLTILSPHSGLAEDVDMKIGVLAFRGTEAARSMWEPTATYLSNHIPGYHFNIAPLTLQGMHQAAHQRSVDFVLTNPGNYVDLEARYGASRLATLRNVRQGKPYTVFSAVILTRADRSDIKTLHDLKGQSFMAVSKHAFGGFQMAWRELKENDIDPFSDFSRLEFAGFPQDDIVYAIRDGRIDAGTVRSDTLARMAQEGKIRRSDFRVLNERSSGGYPFAHSTRIYPEWPFAKLNHTPEALGQQVAIALLTLPPDSNAATSGKSAGWTIPLDYGPVHDLFQTLQIGPYEALGKITLTKVLTQYWRWLLGGAVILMVMGLVTIYVLRINRRLALSQQVLQQEVAERKEAQAQLARHRDTLELRVKERTQELLEDIRARQQVEETLRRSESALRRLHEITTSADLDFRSKLRQLLDMGCKHFDLPTGLFSQIHDTNYEILEVISTDARLKRGNIMPLGDTFCQIVLASRNAVAIQQVGQSAYRDLPVVQHMGLETYFGVVVQVTGQIFGTLCFFSTEHRKTPFSSVDQDILQLMAQWVGEELERQDSQEQARRHQDALAHVSRLGTMGQMASALAH
ncbi:MAG: PhnD/SsuA/transferrin family substrate-binding protein, partial [Gammaproteobacteria bacterium]